MNYNFQISVTYSYQTQPNFLTTDYLNCEIKHDAATLMILKSKSRIVHRYDIITMVGRQDSHYSLE